MSTIRTILGYPFAILWDAVTRVRNLFYEKNVFTSQAFDIPTIGVGNLAMGGTGKTPHIEYLIRLFDHYQIQPAVLSRGYKRKTTGYIFASTQSTVKHIGDEPLQYKIKHPHIAVAVSESRVLGIPQLLMDAPESQLVLLDDVYQHRAVEPGFLILLTDYNLRYSKDFCFPAGTLRESKQGANRADLIIVSKCPANLTKEEADAIRKELNPLPSQHVYFSHFHYGRPYHFLTNEPFDYEDPEVVIATGIAKPTYLENYVRETYKDAFLLDFGDHHLFTERDIYDIEKLFNNLGSTEKVIFITEKDAVKFLPFAKLLHELQLPIYVQPIQVGILFEEGKQLNTELLNFVENFR